jgi:Ser/Thr protein kinase RdoA (MazF antagonist)
MPAGPHFSSEELVQVLSRYDIGEAEKLKPLSAGSARVVKVVIISERGKFLLKRRRKSKNLLQRLTFSHEVQAHLRKKRFPVTALVTTGPGGTPILQIGDHIYECFKFVTGVRYDGSVEATVEAGRQLARLHRALADFGSQGGSARGSFHDSSTVRRHLKKTGSKKTPRPSKKLQVAAELLMRLYNTSSVRVNELGFDSWRPQVVHGDWHPGNMLFSRRKLLAILDFDSIKLAPTVTDLANGMLQFSIVGGRPNPANWPALRPKKNQLNSLLDLMIETMIAEAILPIAATGSFCSLSGLDFLKMIQRKAEWINENRKELAAAMQT